MSGPITGYGRWLRAAALVCACSAATAHAQAVAPEVPDAASAPAQAAAPAQEAAAPAPVTPAATDEQVIDDPELLGAATAASAHASVPTSAGSGGDAQVRAVLHSRFARDVHSVDPRQEIWEGTTLGTLDASIRRSEKLRFGLGVRARYRYASLAHDVPDATAEHHELDGSITAGYADLTLARGLHLQVGYQPVHLGRFDVLSATNFLSVSDLRDGPSTMPEGAVELGQLAAVVDYDANSWLSVRAIYIPFFTPHLLSYTESDYAIFPSTQAASEAAISSAGGPMGAGRLTKLVRNNLSRGDRARLAQTGFSSLAPEPTFSEPQGALRITAHGPAGELALTAGSALEHMPTLELSQSFVDYQFDPSVENQGFLIAAPRPARVHHDRFGILSLDGATDVGPITLGAEASLMLHRTIYALRERGLAESVPGAAHGNLAQLGVRAEYAANDQWLVALETFAAYALSVPDDAACKKPHSLVDSGTHFSDCRFMFLEHGRYMRGAALLASFSPTDLGLHFELSTALVSGPSFVFMPRVGYAPWSDFEVEVGALFVEGPSPSTTAAPDIALGGIYDHVDQVFLGVRYQP